MKMKITLCSILFSFATSAFAQSFVFYQGDTPLANGAEITVSKLDLDEFGESWVMESGLSLKNTAEYSLPARVDQIVLIPPGFGAGFLSFCFDQCQSVNANVSQEGRIAANTLVVPPFFHLSFFIVEEAYTLLKVKYEVVNLEDINDKAAVTITYDYNENSTGLIGVDSEKNINVFQDGNKMKFNYSFDTDNIQLEIYNVLGEKAAQHRLSSEGLFTLPEELTKGIYIYTITNNNKILTARKFIVK
jgi:hypothetical protein